MKLSFDVGLFLCFNIPCCWVLRLLSLPKGKKDYSPFKLGIEVQLLRRMKTGEESSFLGGLGIILNKV